MPEILEVRAMADGIRNYIKNYKLLSIEWFRAPGKKTYNCAYSLYNTIPLPLSVSKVYSHGKKVILYLESEVYLIGSPLMSGSFLFKQTEHSRYVLNFGLRLDSKNIILKRVYFNDPRCQGLLNVYLNKTDFESKMSEIGPDLLNTPISVSDFTQKIKNPKIVNKQICEFLMDQKYVAGIGNYLCAEILYKSKIKPDRILKDIDSKECELIHSNIYSTLDEVIKCNGLTIRDFLTPDEKVGTYDTLVYGKSFDSLGNPVVKSEFKNKRTSHWVPNIQI
jgi:DNA-formamidopyrimidine glycosylase